MRLKRRQFIRAALVGGGGAGLVNVFRQPRVAAAPPLPEVEAFKKTQQRLLAKYNVSARSRYLKLTKPALTTHVLEAGDGKPLLMLHGGGLFACQFAPLIGGLQKQFRVFAVDRPGCGLTDTFHYGGVALRQHAIDFVNGVLDALNLPEVALAGASMGGLWALMFALAKPERVTKLALLGEPAWSAAEPHPPAPATKPPTIESVREGYRARSVANIARVPDELLEAALAARRLPGASESWNSLLERFLKEKTGTYHLRPELKNLRPPTLFIWGEQDTFGSPDLGVEMSAIAPHARCERVRDAGHHIWLDQPEKCAELMLKFLKS